ncbi:TonB-dependent siderophore receptor [Tistrella mobilis]|uniref:Ferrichrome-iron receptor n=1 Tax=Tistrella mobilis (strain KA081020-065) TaxID=1110502 RepID=I3TP51_TISMK|nr:TonB-dependent receptor [Tistrella mobilis]AFK54539.1 ferrichrome-iron receptor [Tistrella mobilis KA081020-065]
MVSDEEGFDGMRDGAGRVTIAAGVGFGLMTVLAPVGLMALTAGASVAVAAGMDRIAFDIPARPLDEALAAFGRQAGVQVSGAAEVVAGRRGGAVQGQFSVDEALGRLLAGTGIGWITEADGTVTLLPAPPSDGTTRLDPLTVTGSRRAVETATGPVEGYLATRSFTATKTDASILETPLSVQVVPRDVIEDQGSLNLKDVYENVSGVQQAGNTLNAQSEVLPMIRGFESPGLLRNGLRATSTGAVDLVNVERVEVLKGPASILYGALEPGGVVNVVTKRPQAEAAYVLEQQLGTDELFRTSVDLTGPVTTDRDLLYRLNAAYTDAGSFRDEMDVDRYAVAPSLLWLPDDDTELLVDLAVVHEEQPYDTGIPLGTDGRPLVDPSTFFGDPDLDGRTIDDYTAAYQLTHRLDDTWTLRNQLQFHRADSKNEALRPRGVVDTATGSLLPTRYQNEDRREDEIQFVLDATAAFQTGTVDHEVLLGAELIRQDSDVRRSRVNGPVIPISNDPQVDFPVPANLAVERVQGTTEWAGFYLQDQISLLDDGRLKLLLGGRYDTFRQDNESNGVATPDIEEGAFTGRAGVLYRLTPQYSVYASVTQSFLPQRPGILDRSGSPILPEEGLQYEVGAKAAFFDEQLLATVSVFQIEKENVAVFDNALYNATGASAYLADVRERSRGFEFDLTGQVTDGLKVIANYAFTETETLSNPDDPAAVGQPLGGVPRRKARLWMTYDFQEGDRAGGLDLYGWGLGGGVRYTGTSTAQFDPSIELDDYIVTDAALWYAWGGGRVGLNLYNLFDEDYIVRASDRSIAHPGQPFAVLGSLTLRF